MTGPKWKRGFVEFLAIFLGVSLSFLAEDWRESLGEARQGNAVLRGIERDLSQEREAIQSTLRRDSLAVAAGAWLYANWSREDAPRDSIDQMLGALVGFGPTLTVRAAYESAKASGRLDFIRNGELRADVVAFYEQNQADFVGMAQISMDYVAEMNRALRPYIELERVGDAWLVMNATLAGSWSEVGGDRDTKNAVGESTAMRQLAVEHARAYLTAQGELLEALSRTLDGR